MFLVINLFDGNLQENLRVIEEINGELVLQNLCVLAVAMIISAGLKKIHPLFEWSLYSVFKGKNKEGEKDKSTKGQNIHLQPTKIKYFGILFTLLFIVNLPNLTMIEEVVFRQGTSSWFDGLIRSLLFGIAHCLVGVPIGTGIAIAVPGIWFTSQYFLGGVELSALHHTTYNLIILSMLLLSLVIKHIIDLVRKDKSDN